MHKVAKLRSGWCNPSESYASYSWRLEEAARVFVTSLVYAVLNWWVLDMASAGASGIVTVEDQRSYIKIESLRGKTSIEIHSALHEVWGEQTVDRSTVSRWATRFREGRVTINDYPRPGRPKASTDKWSVRLVVAFLAQDHQVTCKEISQATGTSPTSVFRILTNDLQKRRIFARWVPHCLIAAEKQKCLENANWNKDLMLKVKHSCIELSPLTKRGLETLNQIWNCSQMRGEVQPPHVPKHFDEHNQRSSKWSLLMITEESSWQSSMWNKCYSSVLSWLDAKIAQKNAQKPTWLARGWATHFAWQCTPAPGKGCDRFVN